MTINDDDDDDDEEEEDLMMAVMMVVMVVMMVVMVIHMPSPVWPTLTSICSLELGKELRSWYIHVFVLLIMGHCLVLFHISSKMSSVKTLDYSCLFKFLFPREFFLKFV